MTTHESAELQELDDIPLLNDKVVEWCSDLTGYYEYLVTDGIEDEPEKLRVKAAIVALRALLSEDVHLKSIRQIDINFEKVLMAEANEKLDAWMEMKSKAKRLLS